MSCILNNIVQTLSCQIMYPGAGVAQSVSWLTTDWTTGVRSPTEAEDVSSSLCLQTGSGAHPASCSMGTGGPFPRVKRGRGVMLTNHPHRVPRLSMSRNYTSSHHMCLHGVYRDSLLYFYLLFIHSLPQWDILMLRGQYFLLILYIVGMYFQFLLSKFFS
jgi:hypothetical protein